MTSTEFNDLLKTADAGTIWAKVQNDLAQQVDAAAKPLLAQIKDLTTERDQLKAEVQSMKASAAASVVPLPSSTLNLQP